MSTRLLPRALLEGAAPSSISFFIFLSLCCLSASFFAAAFYHLRPVSSSSRRRRRRLIVVVAVADIVVAVAAIAAVVVIVGLPFHFDAPYFWLSGATPKRCFLSPGLCSRVGRGPASSLSVSFLRSYPSPIPSPQWTSRPQSIRLVVSSR